MKLFALIINLSGSADMSIMLADNLSKNDCYEMAYYIQQDLANGAWVECEELL